MKKFLLLFLFMIFCGLNAAGEVIFIHGWNFLTPEETFEEPLTALRKIFPGEKVSLHRWAAEDKDFGKTLADAETEAVKLAEKLKKLSPAERENVTLVGHSLGGLITIRTMAQLRRSGMRIRQGIVMGAAIPDDDPDIALAIRASVKPNVSIYHREDYVLRHAYLAYKLYCLQRAYALGAHGYSQVCDQGELFQIRAADLGGDETFTQYMAKLTGNHQLLGYLLVLEKNFAGVNAAEKGKIDRSTADNLIKVPLAYAGEIPVPRQLHKMLRAKVLDNCGNWQLVRFQSPPRRWKKIVIPGYLFYAISDPRERIAGWTRDEKEAQKAFAEVKAQILANQ